MLPCLSVAPTGVRVTFKSPACAKNSELRTPGSKLNGRRPRLEAPQSALTERNVSTVRIQICIGIDYTRPLFVKGRFDRLGNQQTGLNNFKRSTRSAPPRNVADNCR